MRGVTLSLKRKHEILPPSSSYGLLNPFTFQLNDRLSVRLYQDSRPKCLETAPLQKGLVLLLDDKELIEEGVGFGVPVVKYKDKTYFSGTAKSWVHKDEECYTLVKSFVLDTISRKRFGRGAYVNDELYNFLHRVFELVYLNHYGLVPVLNKVMELRKTLNIQTEFIKVKPRGMITVMYSCRSEEVQIATELCLLELDRCKEILILNEQGSTFFRRYADSSGSVLFDRKIGAWTKVLANETFFSDEKQTLTFTLKQKKSGTLLRGWEKTKDFTSV